MFIKKHFVYALILICTIRSMRRDKPKVVFSMSFQKVVRHHFLKFHRGDKFHSLGLGQASSYTVNLVPSVQFHYPILIMIILVPL